MPNAARTRRNVRVPRRFRMRSGRVSCLNSGGIEWASDAPASRSCGSSLYLVTVGECSVHRYFIDKFEIEPTGMPIAIRVVRTPSGFNSRAM